MKQLNSNRPKAMMQPKSKWKGDLKECSGNGSCGQFLSVDNFTKKGANKGGVIRYRAQCKTCWNIWRRADAKTDEGRNRKRKHMKTYYENHPEKLMEKEERAEASRLITLKKRLIRRISSAINNINKAEANKNRLQDIRDRVKEFGYDILSEFNATNDYALVRCENGHERKVRISNILSGSSGCNGCRINKGQQRLVEASKKMNGGILTKYVSKHKRVLYLCSNGHKTMRYPHSIWDGHHCGECENGSNNYSYYHGDEQNQNRTGYFYEFYFNLNSKAYKMIGIATVWKSRLSQYKSAGIKPFNVSLTKMNMYEAFICEQEILHRKDLQEIKSKGLGFGGSTECFDITDVDLFHPVHSV